MTVRTAIALSVLLCISGVFSARSVFAPHRGWISPAELIEHLDKPGFQHNMMLLANATKLSYTATWGSYYSHWDANATIGPGWVKSSLEANPKDGGMHALLFVENTTSRALLVFRGTDLGPDAVSSNADICADSLLWNGYHYNELPAMCQNYSVATLDYFTNAIAFTNTAMSMYSGYDFLFTGHSLGAGLAQMMASVADAETCVSPSAFGATSAGAVVFSTPGYIHPLLNRTNISVANLDKKKFVELADRYDPVWAQCNISFQGGIAGHRCLWHDGNESAACVECESDPAKISFSRPGCAACFLERHIFAHYLHLVEGGAAKGLLCDHHVADPCAGSEAVHVGADKCHNLVQQGCSVLHG